MEVNNRKHSAGSVSNASVGGRSRLLSLTPFTGPSRSRANSCRLEIVDMPGGPMLVELNDDDIPLDPVAGGRGSVVGGVVGAPDTHLVDKIIKQEMAHHSPAVGAEPRESIRVAEGSGRKQNSPRVGEDEGLEAKEPVLAFGATNLLQHLHLALASPALFRLPALAYKWSSPEGSGFLGVYTVLLLILAPQLSILEQTMAQFSSLGPTTIFRSLPILTGVGVGMVCVCAVLMPYTSTVLAWTVQYTVDCLQKEVPWSTCPPGAKNTTCPDELSPSEYYFMRTLLGTNSEEDGNSPRGEQGVVLSLGLTQGLVWLGVILAVWRGEAWRAGVVSRVWALVTAGVLVVLMVYGLQEPSSGVGLGQAFIFTWHDLDKPDLWLDAFGQVLWTVGPFIGLLINRASYRHFRDAIRQDAYTSVVANLVVAMVSCLAVFPFLSHPVEKTPGFFLVESSKAMMSMEVPQLGGVLLYLGLCKGLFDHTQILAFTVTVGVSDLLPGRWRGGGRFFFCCFAVCVFGFLCSLPYVTHEGVFLVKALDNYVPWASGLFLGMLEVAGLVYLYGATTIGQHFKLMLRSDVSVIVFLWRFFLMPILLALGVWACVVGVKEPLTWEDTQLSEAREDAYKVVALVLALLPAGVAVVVTAVQVFRHARDFHQLLVPNESWGPALAGHRALYTPGILRAKARAPYLVVQMDTEGENELPGKGWLPFGFFWVPSKSETQLLPSSDGPTKMLLARYLKSRFRDVKDITEDDAGKAEEDRDEGSEAEAAEQWVQKEVEAAPHEGTNSLVSSGVVLHPKTLVENHTQHLR